MKKHLFLIGSFMTSSLVAANTLLVISCKKKTSIKGNKEDEKGTTEQVEFEKTTKIKNAIRNIIDDVIANPNDKSNNWIINLADGNFNDYENTIKFLNDTIKGFKDKPVKEQQIALDQLTTLDSNLKDKIKEQFLTLSDVIIKRINENEDIGVSNFKFEFKPESIQPILTSLNGVQVMQAISKINKKPTLYSTLTNNATSEEIDKIKIDLFKVKTNLSFSFSFGSVKDQSDDYNNAELLLTGNIDDYNKVARYTQDTIKDFITKTKYIKDVSIFSSDKTQAKIIHTYDYIGKQMDWDFSKTAVMNEIATMQHDNIVRLKEGKVQGTGAPKKMS